MRLSRALSLTASIGLVFAGCAQAGRPRASAPPAAPPDASAVPEAKPDAMTAEVRRSADPDVSFAYGKRTHRDPSDVCETVEENLRRAERAILSEDRSRIAPAAARAWDHASAPRYLDIVDRRLALTSREKATLARNGFVVPARLAARGFADALHDIYQSQLPIFISSDAILHAVYKGNDVAMTESERTLLPRLETALSAMHRKLREGPPYPVEVREDLDLYLTVARTLLAGDDEQKAPDPLPSATPLIESARRGTDGLKTVSLFGRPRVIDWSQYTPRGHYAGDADLERYFVGTMWLSRLELNLVSRASRSSQPGFVPNPEETPREAVDALALADLAERAGVLPDLGAVEHMWTEYAGKREDVSLDQLNELRRRAGITSFTIPDTAEKLKAAIGQDFKRTARIHYMPQGSTPLPAIATMLGPRIVPDTQVETNLVHSAIPGRPMPSFGDVAFMLGSDRAKTYLASDLAAYPDLEAALVKGRSQMEGFDRTSLYTAWLGAIHDLSRTPNGTTPSFTKTKAYADLKLNSTVAAYGQLRHNYVLVAGQGYDEGGCEIPDGYVEPNLALYESLVAYAQRGSAASRAIHASAETIAYFERLERTLGVLVAIVKDELAGRPLADEEKRWLAMTSEIVPPSSDGPGSNDGWYFGLFPRSDDAFSEHAFVADWFTSSNASAIAYAGAREPRLGVFVVDAGGEPRVMVGPVARAFEHIGPLGGRLADKDATRIGALREPWAASYTAPEGVFPSMAVVGLFGGEEGTREVAIRSTRDIGPVTIELLDHHRVPSAKATVAVGPAWKKVVIKTSKDEWLSVVRLRSGEETRELRDSYGSLNAAFGGMKPLEWEESDRLRQKFQKNP